MCNTRIALYCYGLCMKSNIKLAAHQIVSLHRGACIEQFPPFEDGPHPLLNLRHATSHMAFSLATEYGDAKRRKLGLVPVRCGPLGPKWENALFTVYGLEWRVLRVSPTALSWRKAEISFVNSQ